MLIYLSSFAKNRVVVVVVVGVSPPSCSIKRRTAAPVVPTPHRPSDCYRRLIAAINSPIGARLIDARNGRSPRLASPRLAGVSKHSPINVQPVSRRIVLGDAAIGTAHRATGRRRHARSLARRSHVPSVTALFTRSAAALN